MKPRSVLLLGSLLVAACSKEAKPVEKTYSFSYQGEYYPSFMPPCAITIVARGLTNRVNLRAYDDRGATQKTILLDSARLSNADLTFFFAKLGSVPVLEMATKEQAGTDGITVYNTISKDSASNTFKFWSPRKHSAPQEHQLVEAVLGLCERKFTAQKEHEYFESLEQYFDFGLPCKITSLRPFEVRMYGNLSFNEEQALTRFMQQLPSDRSILIDVTNFEGMGTMFYPLFRNLLARNNQLVWVSSEWSRKQLREIGVPSDRITASTAEGRAVRKNLSGTAN